jgi:hypothetical protein
MSDFIYQPLSDFAADLDLEIDFFVVEALQLYKTFKLPLD